VGWVMTQGGVNALTETSRKDLTTIQVGPTSVPTSPPPIQIGDSGKLEQVRAEYEAKLREMQGTVRKTQEEADKRIEKLKLQYTTQLNDLNVKVLMLEEDNKRLRGEK
jgi:hypothetical protein